MSTTGQLNDYKNFSINLTFTIIAFGALLSLFSSVSFAQSSKRLVVTGKVIGVEQPDLGWAMHFQSVKIFYVRIDKVLKGKSPAKYIRIAYGSNPISAPQYILPQEMFDGKTHWKFDLSAYSDFDAKVAVSKLDGDWIDTKNTEKTKGIDFLLENDAIKNEEFTIVSVIPKCVPIAGYEKEASILETFEIVKGYWLSFEGKNFKKLKG